ncbi:MAG: ABC transporter substrate-binding protein [Lachnospiraceae bacterium]|nr:ABC transporter substrate-binding protein [Lachnospiraceae bacterium]
MKIYKLFISLIMVLSLCGCTSKSVTTQEMTQSDSPEKGDLTVIGFSQLGAESDWRSSNTQSMKTTFTEENGYRLIFEDGQQKQANQIMAIRKFIQQEVDYIVLAPVTETGWDTVLREAKDANIPVIIVDRMVDVKDDSLYECWIGSDFKLEGMKMCQWLNDYCKKKGIRGSDLRIVDLQGNIGATAQIGRTRGLSESARKFGWKVLEYVPADFTQTKGREVMKTLLRKYDDINVVYCENDNEALGAIEAIEEAGKVAGPNIRAGEIMVLSFDGINEDARQYVIDNKISCIAECNPLHGPRVKGIIEKLEKGQEPPKLSYVGEDIYAHDKAVESIRVDSIEYPITVLQTK